MPVKFPHIRLCPKTVEELHDPEFMRDLAIKKMSGIRSNGDEAATSQDRKDLLIALSRVRDITRWVEVIGEFCVIAPLYEQKVGDDGNSEPSDNTTKTRAEKSRENLAKARAVKAQMVADGVMASQSKKAGVDYGDGDKHDAD